MTIFTYTKHTLLHDDFISSTYLYITDILYLNIAATVYMISYCHYYTQVYFYQMV
jgi:hypothetical protein